MSDYYQDYAQKTKFSPRFPNAHQPSGNQNIIPNNQQNRINQPPNVLPHGIYNPTPDVPIRKYDSINSHNMFNTQLGLPPQLNNRDVFTHQNFDSNYFPPPSQSQRSLLQEPNMNYKNKVNIEEFKVHIY